MKLRSLIVVIIFFAELLIPMQGMINVAGDGNLPSSTPIVAPSVISEAETENEVSSMDETLSEEVEVDAEAEVEPVEEAEVETDVEAEVESEAETEVEAETETGAGYVNANVDESFVSGSEFEVMGIHYDSSGYSFTYYSEIVLPGGGLDIPGRHVGDEGYVCDGDGNLCLASDDLPYGTVVNVPFGTGTAVVYDCGSGSGNLDVYVSW